MNDPGFFIDYHLWAHKRILEQLRALTAEDWNKPLGGSFPTMKALYQHVLEADYRWLQRWKGVPFAEVPADMVVDGYASLQALWLPLLDEQMTVAKSRLAAGAEEPVHFITGKGLHVTQPFWQTLYQVVNHGTYHRGQASTMLRMLDKPSVGTDIFLFFNENALQ
ncbi:MAG TPA: DinB family protein [Puia sp.]|nr:DinB family protein [Puia sp.]